MFGLSKVAFRIVAALALVVLILLALQLRSCAIEQQRAAQSRVDKGQAGAAVNSGAEAMNTVSGVVTNEQATADRVKENTDAIRSQPAGHSNDAAIRAACRMHSAAALRDRRCAALRGADPGNASGGR